MKKPIKGCNTPLRVISKTVVSPGVIQGHELVQDVMLVKTSSSDPDWDGATATSYGQSDHINGTGSHKGYTTHAHEDGSESHFRFEGTHETTVRDDGSWETKLDGTFQWTGGTGKFENVAGGGTYGGTVTANRLEYEWEGEIEL